jgi:tRNA threonylcarbamoyladenosine biosynthesis protein TsaB
MALVLSLETSTDVCSVALHNDRTLVAEIELHQAQAHASKLAPLISEVLIKAGVSLNQVNAVAISSGPGSYTGLRIGTSTAKGICYTLEIPLVTVSTLKLLAFQASSLLNETALLCPMIDARRMEVYCQVFDNQLNEVLPVEAKIIEEDAFQELLATTKIFFFGNGAMKCKSTLQHQNAYFLEENIFPLATTLGTIAIEKLLSKQVENLVTFEPFYLKDFVAKKAKSPLA